MIKSGADYHTAPARFLLTVTASFAFSAPPPKRITIATRQSRLALWQAEHVKALLQAMYPAAQIALLGMTTRGDQILDRPLSRVGGKGLFVKELETALLDGRADIAVHSMKDVPMRLDPAFALVATTERALPLDALVSNKFASLDELPPGAVVGTSSLRRQAQVRALYPYLAVSPLRGNLDTRLGKLDAGEYDVIILAAAGLSRLGLEARIRARLPAETMLPAVGQGALAIEARADRADVAAWMAPLDHPASRAAVLAERALSRALAGSCEVPLAAFAEPEGERLMLRALVGLPDGSRVLRAERSGLLAAPEPLGEQVAQDLIALGAEGLLASLGV
jgi:hydroxymethylbilane synthase